MSIDKRLVVLSVDYEIFGNGSGDVRQHVVEPTDRMARICESHGVPLTVFFEVEEYLAFQRHRGPLVQALGYDPAQLIRTQICSLARAGHDIQLHLHPQWREARWGQDGWTLRPEKETVDSLFETQGEANTYVAERKQVIDDLLAKAGTGRKVQAYRAGAFSAQPGTKLLAALVANDIFVDSSVVKGMTFRSNHIFLDYRPAPSFKDPWRVSQDVAQEDRRGRVWEVPIYAVAGRRWQQLTVRRLKAKFSRNVPRNHQHRMVEQLGFGRNPFKLARFLFSPTAIKYDFHNLSPVQFLRWTMAAPKPAPGRPDVLVSIGHTKEHTDDAAFDRLVSLVAAESTVQVTGFTEVAAALASHRPANQPTEHARD